MKTAVKPTGGCRLGFALFDGTGSLRQYRWGELREQGLAVWTFRDGRWVRIRTNRDLRHLGEFTVIAAVDASVSDLENQKVASPQSFTAKDAQRVERLRAMFEEGPLCMVSNRFARLGAEERQLLERLWQVRDESDIRHMESGVSELYARALSEPTDANIATLLEALRRPSASVLWQQAADSFCERVGLALPEANGLLDVQVSRAELAHLLRSPRPGESVNQALADGIIDLAVAIQLSYSLESRDPRQSLEVARDLMLRFGSPRLAMCYLARIDAECSLEEASAVFALSRFGPISPQDALAAVRQAGGGKDVIGLLSSELYNTGRLSEARVAAIVADHRADPVAAAFRYGSASLSVEAYFKDQGREIRPADAAALAGALGWPGQDRSGEDLRLLLQGVPLDAFEKAMRYAKSENTSGVPNAELALRLAAAFGPRMDEYLQRMTSPSAARQLELRLENVAPGIVADVLLARRGRDYVREAQNLDETRVRRREVGNAQGYSAEQLQGRLDTLQSALPSIEAARMKVSAKLQEAQRIEDPVARQAEYARLQRELETYGPLLKSKQQEIEALGTLIAAHPTATDEELARLVTAWVAATPSKPPQNVGLSLHDAAFWLPSDPKTAAAMGAWLLEGDRAEKTFARPTGIADLMLVSAAWNEMNLDGPGSRSFGRVLEQAREVAGSHDLGDRFTAALSKSGATTASAQRSLDMVRASFETPTPFPLERTWNEGGLKARFLPRDDVRGTQLGMLTNCCQHPEGAGRTCAEGGQTHPSMGFFVVEDAAGRVVSQSWAWVDGSGGLCFDNVEGRPAPSERDAVVALYQQASRDLLDRFDRVTVGAHNAVEFHGVERATPLSLSSIGYSGYTDTRSGQLLLAGRTGSKDDAVITFGLADGFIWRQGESSVTVRGSSLTLEGPGADAIAERMLPSMGARTWEVHSESGTRALTISENEHLTPSIDGMPLSLFSPSPEQRARMESAVPGLTDADATAWFAAVGRDVALFEAAVAGGWSIEAANTVMRSGGYGARALHMPMPDAAVVHGISLGYSPERAVAHLTGDAPSREILQQASLLSPSTPPASFVAVLPAASRSSRPAEAAVALSMCSTEALHPAVLELVDRGVDPLDIRNMLRQHEAAHHHDSLFSPKYIERTVQLSPEQVDKFSSHVYGSASYHHPEVLFAIADLPREEVDAVLTCDRVSRHDGRTVEFVTSGGNPEDWKTLERTVALTDRGQRLTGAVLAGCSVQQIQSATEKLDAAQVERAHGEYSPPHYFSPRMLDTFSDTARVERAVHTVEQMLGVFDEGTRSYVRVENSSAFAGLVEADVRVEDAMELARLGISPRTLAGACGAYVESRRPSSDDVSRIAALARRGALTNDVATSLLTAPHLIGVASDVLGGETPSPQATGMLKFVLQDRDQGGSHVFAEAWRNPQHREALLEASKESWETPADLVAAALSGRGLERHGGARRPEKRRPVFV